MLSDEPETLGQVVVDDLRAHDEKLLTLYEAGFDTGNPKANYWSARLLIWTVVADRVLFVDGDYVRHHRIPYQQLRVDLATYQVPYYAVLCVDASDLDKQADLMVRKVERPQSDLMAEAIKGRDTSVLGLGLMTRLVARAALERVGRTRDYEDTHERLMEYLGADDAELMG